MKKLLVTVITFLFVIGCHYGKDTNVTSDMLLAETIIANNRAADIFIFNDHTYERVNNGYHLEDIVHEEIIDKKIGEIVELYSNKDSIKNGMANLLPEGTEIYSTLTSMDDEILLIKVNGQWLEYKIVEMN
ncbi:hypothetical protein [Evansella tamaricis]|uniref:Uncharacterized protein n=1 Tax=Evansella tamaricis TaxID=2069301 RepID=A0ABS6JHG6_9BACI|nr:hypothetical protein [Evansella tamaricis]MBU9713119.1 hypothetical protein [Evansella tamaricis]